MFWFHKVFGFRVVGLGLCEGSGLRVLVLGLRVMQRFKVWGFGCRVARLGIWGLSALSERSCNR